MDTLTEIVVLRRNVDALHSALKLKVEEINRLNTIMDSLQNQLAMLNVKVQELSQTTLMLKAVSKGHGPTG